MAVAEKIQQYVQSLPESLQIEVLDFVEYLQFKLDRTTADQDEEAWSQSSLAAALRGMEAEASPVYTAADLDEVFSR